MTVDTLIIGAGPAGLAAAVVLAEHRASVMVVDEQAAPGGQIYRAVERMPARLRAVLGSDYAQGADLVARFRAAGVQYRPSSSVWQIVPGMPHEIWLSAAGCSAMVQARTLIVATGAMERPVPAPGWTLPGAMSAGAVQILLKSASLAPEGLVLAGSGPLLYLLGGQCIAAGAKLTAILDTTSRANAWASLRHLPAAIAGGGGVALRKGLALIARLRMAGVPVHTQVTDIRIEGADAVAGIGFRSKGRPVALATKLVALHEGVIPAQQAPRSIGCAFDWDGLQHCFRPRTDEWGNSSVAGVLIAGDGAGIGGARAAEHAGRIAAMEALQRLGRIDAATRDRLAVADRTAWTRHLSVRPFLDTLFAPPPSILRPADEVTICRCEEVAAGAIRAVAAQGCQGPNQVKSFLRAGMGPCQGRICGPVVAELIAEARGVGMDEVGYFRIRPPLKPISVGELAAVELPGE